MLIKLPEDFIEKIINRYEDIGKVWLNNIDAIIEKYTKMFNLKNIEVVKELTMNIVIFANSDNYGDIVLKISAPGKTYLNELKFIKYCSSNHMVKCYYYNIEDRVMILEKINPGYSLYKLENIDERIKIFCDILNDITKNNNYLNEFRTYGDTLNEKINEAKHKDNISPNILYMLNKAALMYEEINRRNLPKFILHHDLQHKNILKSEYGWKVIDPHGIVGEKVIETSQFIRAELANKEVSIKQINIIVEKISKYLNEDIILIYKALYIEIVTKILFFIKSGDDKRIILYNINICKTILEYINQ